MKIEINGGFEAAKKKLFEQSLQEKELLLEKKTEYSNDLLLLGCIGVIYLIIRMTSTPIVYAFAVVISLVALICHELYVEKKRKQKIAEHIHKMKESGPDAYFNHLYENCFFEADEEALYQYWDLLQFKEASDHKSKIERAFVHSPDESMNGAYTFVYRDKHGDLHLMGFYREVTCLACEKGKDRLVWEDGSITHYSHDVELLQIAAKNNII